MYPLAVHPSPTIVAVGLKNEIGKILIIITDKYVDRLSMMLVYAVSPVLTKTMKYHVSNENYCHFESFYLQGEKS